MESEILQLCYNLLNNDRGVFLILSVSSVFTCFCPFRWCVHLTSTCPEPVVYFNTWPLSDEGPVSPPLAQEVMTPRPQTARRSSG